MQAADDTTDDTFPAESFANWLFGEVDGALDPTFPPVLRSVTAADLTAQSVAAVLALAFDRGQPAQTRVAAIDSMWERYEAAQAARFSPERVDALNQIMGDVIASFNALQVRKVSA